MKRLCLALTIVLTSCLTNPARAQQVTPSHATNLSVEILSDTKGVDLAPYMRTTVAAIRSHWLPLVTQVGHQPLREPNETIISLTVAPDGNVSEMKLEHPTGNTALDKAAWTATTSVHYAPLPSGMKDSPLKMRILFPAR